MKEIDLTQSFVLRRVNELSYSISTTIVYLISIIEDILVQHIRVTTN